MSTIQFPQLEPSQATLDGALIAAFVALIVALLAYYNSRGAEVRSSQRKLLETQIPKLGTALHEVVATSEMLLKTKTPESRKSWDKRGNDAKTDLLDCQMETRYALWGITGSFRTLSRLPSWAQHAMRHPAKARTIVNCGKALGRALDLAVLACLHSGKPPNRWHRFWVKRRDDSLIRAYKNFQATPRQPNSCRKPTSKEKA